MHKNRHILLLQGPSSMFFSTVGAELCRNQMRVSRLVFCPGDLLYWRRNSGKRILYRDTRAQYPDFLRDLINSQNITDILCLGDGRYWHRIAIEVAKTCLAAPEIHIIEHGYYRSGLLTFERGGIHANSNFLANMDLHNWIGFALEKNPLKKFQSSFLRYAMLDIGWNLSNILLAPLFFPYFKSHALDHPVTEWKGWISKGLTYPLTAKNIRQVSRQISAHKGGIFLFPLQLATDFQIREHGPKGGLVNTVQTTIESFSRHAPADALLLFKIHPLDNLRVNWHSLIKKAAINFKCSDRCLFVKGGDLNGFLSKSAGCVTVNSTVGLTAIEMGIPTHVLGKAIYKVDGLTNEKPLSTFWRNPKPPCRKLAQAFKTALISATQIRGAFDGSGAPVGARNIAARLIADHPSQF